MANCNCCVFNNAVAIDTSDPCVCNAAIGTTLVTSTGVIYVRTTQTNPCAVGDWAAINNNVGGFSITDAFANTQIVNTNDIVTFLGVNGITATVSATDTITIDGLTTFGIVAPVAAPAVPTQVNIYYDCAANQIYLWCPNTLTWNNPNPAQTPLTVVDTDSINLTASGTDNHTLQADAIIAPTQGLIDNALSTIAGQGLYVPAPEDYLVINDLLDVDTATTPPVAGDVLSWDGTNWVPVAQFNCEMVQDCMSTALPFTTYNDGLGTFTLGSVDFHSDVDTTTTVPVLGQVLAWDGTNWVPTNATAAFACANLNTCSINALLDVDTTTNPPVTNQPLMWDGTNWTPIDATCPAATQVTTALGFSSAGAYGWFGIRQTLPQRNTSVNTSLIPATDGVLFVDASGGNITITLVAPAACNPQDFYIKRTDTVVANTVTISGALSIDNGGTAITLATPGPFSVTGGESVHLVHSGANAWFIL